MEWGRCSIRGHDHVSIEGHGHVSIKGPRPRVAPDLSISASAALVRAMLGSASAQQVATAETCASMGAASPSFPVKNGVNVAEIASRVLSNPLPTPPAPASASTLPQHDAHVEAVTRAVHEGCRGNYAAVGTRRH